jgi:hypothetical protein
LDRTGQPIRNRTNTSERRYSLLNTMNHPVTAAVRHASAVAEKDLAGE